MAVRGRVERGERGRESGDGPCALWRRVVLRRARLVRVREEQGEQGEVELVRLRGRGEVCAGRSEARSRVDRVWERQMGAHSFRGRRSIVRFSFSVYWNSSADAACG